MILEGGRDGLNNYLRPLYLDCTIEEAKRFQSMKNKKVLLRAMVTYAHVSDVGYMIGLKFYDEVPIRLGISLPSMDGFLPESEKGGGHGFPHGTFVAMVDGEEWTLRLENQKITASQGKTKVVEWVYMTDVFVNGYKGIYITGPFTGKLGATRPTTRSHATSYSWEMICGELTPRLNSSQPLSG